MRTFTKEMEIGTNSTILHNSTKFTALQPINSLINYKNNCEATAHSLQQLPTQPPKSFVKSRQIASIFDAEEIKGAINSNKLSPVNFEIPVEKPLNFQQID